MLCLSTLALLFVVPVWNALMPAFGVMAVALALALPVALARRARYPLPILLPASLVCFALVLPRPAGADALGELHKIGATGIFLALIACGVTGGAIALARNAVIGALLAVAAFALLTFGFHADVSAAIAAALAPIGSLGDSLPALAIIVAAQMLLWMLGIHGSAMLSAVLTPVYLTLQMENTAAFVTHFPLPHIVVSSLFLFIYPGGSGATLPLAILVCVSRVKRLRTLGRIAILPALANVNEPLLYGLPIALNPSFAIPFFATPLVLAATTYGAMALGLVARPAFYVPPLVPAPIATYLATLDPHAVLLVLVNIAISTLIYLPFLRAYERKAL